MADSKEGPDWTNLAKNVVVLIVEKLVPPLSQFVMFGLVCKDWHTTIVDDHLLRRQVLKGCHRQVPLLMIPTKDKSPERRCLYNIIRKKTYHTELSVPYSRRCCGSSYGWIATVDHTSAVKLINPFTNGIIDLPPIDTFFVNFITEEDEYEFYVKKVILSDDPYVNPDNFMILGLFGGLSSIVIIRSGEITWTYTRTDLETIAKADAIFFKGKAYVVDWGLGIISVDVTNTDSNSFEEKMVIPPKHYEEVGIALKYIVESCDGEILIVQRFYTTSDAGDESLHHWTVNFKVFKVERHATDEARLVEINNIGDEVLFLGDNSSISVVTSRFPGCRSNCIYFTDDIILFVHPYLPSGPIDMGIFSLETGCFDRYYDHHPSHLDMPPPFFILPTLSENRDSPYLHL
ncbi:hypothetical protein V6N13_111997 [Hibiscus sabdariffa]|uniref:KIB1-4 beta-propeller domain-containing protein n=1 Tax=Hibiscus sabdariffa TaxID=183260 RepID=A0ABR2TM45_9ROSI